MSRGIVIAALLALSIQLALGFPNANPASKKAFHGYTVVRAAVKDRAQQVFLHSLQNEHPELDFWKQPKLNEFADIMTAAEDFDGLRSVLQEKGIVYEILIQDVQALIAEEEERRAHFVNTVGPNAISWNEYYDLEQIENWIAELAQNHSSVSLITIGKSTEGRNLTVVKISNGSSSSKHTIFITSTIHAREWISGATATYMINQLVTNSSAHPDILDRVDICILPFINPDGYAYSHSTNRLWRKTRSNHVPSSGCRGADANRNFDFRWGDADVPGSSGSPCSETYRGPEPFSEPEAAAVRDFVEGNRNVNWALYLTLHSYGQYFLSPWGFTQNLPSNYLTMKNLSDNAVAALSSVYGTSYSTGSSANVLYYTDGTDQDWATGSGYFNVSYTMELRDTGRYGFVLPASEILPTAMETFEAIKVLARNLP